MKRCEDQIPNRQRLTQTPYNFVGATFAGLLVVFFCLILLWHSPLVFWNDDYELSVLPVFADMARSWSEGHFPILSPYSWVCGNLAGEFQYGVFSVFVNAVVIVVWKFPLTFPQQAAAVSIAHLFALAVGAFLLARDRQFSVPLSIFVALITSLNGWIICWGATDWFGALGAFTWLPWAWWGAARALDPRRGKWRFLWPAPFVYLVVTGGFPYTVLMLLVLVAWLAIKFATANPSRRAAGGSLTGTRSILSVAPMLFGVALGFGLSAPAWLAILDLVQGSARELQPARAHWQWLVPPAALPSLILPCWTVNWSDFSNRYLPHTATELACGLVAPAALISGLLWRAGALVRQIKWELVLLLVVLLLCMIPTPMMITFLALLATYVWIPTNCDVPRYNFSQDLLKPEPLDPARLYLGIYPWAELTYCVANKPQPVGEVLRPGSTPMWAGLHFINGYSPIRPAGVAREFQTSIHGEINPSVGGYLLSNQAGKDGELALLGVDGIVVARELDIAPQPTSEWQAALARVRSVTSIDSRPEEQFATATISRINDSRNRVEADVDVPNGDRPALVTFSRPYFRGYEARLSDRKLAVTSYRGLFSIVEVPAGAHGRLALVYRPAWLIWGSATAAACVFVILLAFILRGRANN